MKLKEVCQETGLSRKTIRLYEEKQLLVPKKEYRNGREYREYTPEDIRRLNMIAMLRRAWFTMDEIKRMLEDPNTIQEIFPQYVEWLKNQKQEVDTLLLVAEHLTISDIPDIETLTEHMTAAAQHLPLPQWDITPKFKYLDEIEEATKMTKKNEKDILTNAQAEQKTFRQTTLIMDQDNVNNHAITFGQMKELKTGDYSSDGPVKKEVESSPVISALVKIGFAIFIIGFLVFAIFELGAFMGLSKSYNEMNPTALWAIVAMVIGIVMYGCAHGYAVYQERQRWLKVVRAQDEEKKKKQG